MNVFFGLLDDWKVEWLVGQPTNGIREREEVLVHTNRGMKMVMLLLLQRLGLLRRGGVSVCEVYFCVCTVYTESILY